MSNPKHKAFEFLVWQIPFGEAVDAFKDLQCLFPDENRDHAERKNNVLMDYIGDKRAIVSIPGGGKTVLFPEARLQGNCFLDPRSNLQLELEPAKIQVRSTIDGPERDATCEPLRKAVTTHLDKYQVKQYTRGAARALVTDNGAKVVIVIAAHDSSLRNSWCGSWVSNWYVDVETSLKVTGTIRVHANDSEEATGTFTHKKCVKDTNLPKSDDVDTVARDLLEFIEAQETEVALHIEQSMRLFGDELVPLRRVLPVNKVLCEWSAAGRYQLAQEMRENIY